MKTKFNVIIYNINRNIFEEYDVLPYLRDCLDEYKKRFRNYKRTKSYKECIENNKPFNEYKMFPQNEKKLKDFIIRQSKYQWWARTEYEIILKDWPCSKLEEKIDIHYQVMMNIDIITKILKEEYKIK